jgi:SPP1 gp7 family putative phage head morphogenesis protein
LAYDTASDECRSIIQSINLAEGDDKKRPVRRRRTPRLITYLPHGKDQTAAEITDGKSTPFGLRFDVPPQEAIDYFKRKQILPADRFYALEAEAKAGAFAIGKVNETDITQALRDELIDALQTGRTQQDVIKKLKGILDGAGHKMLGDAHLETVFRTTTQMAYGVGRRIAQEEVADFLPYWEYSAVGDDRTRPTHMALDGLVYPANHPFWDSYYPPWDFRCRCSVIPRFDLGKQYDKFRPNARTAIEYGDDDLPKRVAVDNNVVRLDTTKFQGVPRQASLEQVLTNAASRALENRSN